MEHANLPISQKIGVDYQTLVVAREGLVFAKFTRGNNALGASPKEGTCHKSLFRVIANKIGKNQVTAAPHTVAAHHRDSRFAGLGNWM